MTIKIKDLPMAERPYEKLELQGEKTLSNAELLAIIIKNGTKNITSVELAYQLLALNKGVNEDDLSFLKNISIEELMQIKGIGKVKAIQIKAICELAVRMSRPSYYKNIKIKSPEDIAKIVMPELKNETKEIIKLVMLNNTNQIIRIMDIAQGGINFANLSIPNLLGEVLKAKVEKFIVIHNHPSGSAKPSERDMEITKKIYNTAQIVGLELIDHIVIGNMEYTSIMSIIANNTQSI